MIFKEENEKSAKWLFLYLFYTAWEKHESWPQNSKIMNVNCTEFGWATLHHSLISEQKEKISYHHLLKVAIFICLYLNKIRNSKCHSIMYTLKNIKTIAKYNSCVPCRIANTYLHLKKTVYFRHFVLIFSNSPLPPSASPKSPAFPGKTWLSWVLPAARIIFPQLSW